MNAQQQPMIGHNSASAGQMIEAEPSVVYRDDGVFAALVLEIEAGIAASTATVESKAGRDAIASSAYRIAKIKTRLVDAGKCLTEDWRKKTAAVNAVKAQIERDLDALRDKARAPLDKWEAAERAKIAKAKDLIALFNSKAAVGVMASVESIDQDIELVRATTVHEAELGDEAPIVGAAKETALAALREGRARVVQIEAERAEMARIRAEREAAELAEREAARKRSDEAAEAERIAVAERNAATAAEARAKAEADAAIAVERKRAEDAQHALENERRRQREAEEQRLRAEEAAKVEADRRAADQEHRSGIMRLAKEAVIEHGGVKEDVAKKIVLAIVAGSIPNVSIRF